MSTDKSRSLTSLKTIASAFIFSASAALASTAFAAYPTENITFVVPVGAGGATDLAARIVAKELTKSLGVSVIVENRAGGGGVVGNSHVIRSKPDGYTVLVAPSALGVRAGLDKKLPYDVVQDLAGVSTLCVTPSYLAVPMSLDVKSVDDLVSFAKAEKEPVIYGSAGVGSTAHLHAAMFSAHYGFEGEHTGYTGTPPAVNDMIAGLTTYVFAPGPNVLPFAQEGRLRILATTSDDGMEFVPEELKDDVALLEGDIGDDWYAAFVPAGTPDEVRQKLSQEIAKVVAMPEVKKSMLAIGAVPVSMSPEELDKMLAEYVAEVRDVGEKMNISLE